MKTTAKDQFPLLLRQDWQQAYTGREPVSEPFAVMSENFSYHFLISAQKYLHWSETDGSETLKTIKQSLRGFTKNDEDSGVLRYGQEHLTDLSHALTNYAKEITGVSTDELKHRAKQGEQFGHDKSSADSLAIIHRYIQSNNNLNSRSGLNYWLTSSKPQYAQTALLHSADGIDDAIDAITPNYKTPCKALSYAFKQDHRNTLEALHEIKSAMDETGLTKATEQIKRYIEDETDQQKEHRNSRNPLNRGLTQ